MGVTSQQIAELAGVFRGTVDRALHNRGRGNPEVAAHIRKIAEDLGYQPNSIRQALVRTRQDNLVSDETANTEEQATENSPSAIK